MASVYLDVQWGTALRVPKTRCGARVAGTGRYYARLFGSSLVCRAPKGASGKWPGRVAAPPRPRSLTVEKLYPAEFIEQQPSSIRIEAPDLPQLLCQFQPSLRAISCIFADQQYRRRCVSRRRHDADTRLLSSCVPRGCTRVGKLTPLN
jgi:hypothetical protein